MELTPKNDEHNQIRTFVPQHTAPAIVCCECGQPMVYKGSTMCDDCIALNVDITKEIPRMQNLTFCKKCFRLQVPPNHWIFAPRESRQLLAACLKRLKGLSKVKIVNAKYLWTEPHSRRTKIQITVRGEPVEFPNTLLEQSLTIEYYEGSGMCGDCAKSYTAHTWQATVQVRQKGVTHKKTMYFLEQLILKHGVHKDTLSMKELKEGIDFFFSQRAHAVKMVDFICSVVPAKYKKSQELISEDTHTSHKTYKFSYAVELVPICKDDLVVLPKSVARAAGHIQRLTLCCKIGTTLHLMDPKTLQVLELPAAVYWREPITAVANARKLTEYVVLDIEPVNGVSAGKYALADVTVARAADLGVNEKTYYVRTHLGGILHAGDSALGYDLENANFNHEQFDSLDPDHIPEVMLVRKVFPERLDGGKKKQRNWKLKRMATEYNKGQAKPTQEYEEFLQEIENDDELRAEVELFKPESGLQENEDGEVDEENAQEADSDLEEGEFDDVIEI